MPSGASLSSKESLYRVEMRRELFDRVGFKKNELKEAEFQQIQDVHEQKFEPIQNIDTPLLNRGFTAPIGSKIGTPSTKKEGESQTSARAFLISEDQTEYLVLNSNTEDLVDTRQADIDTDVVLDTSRDPPDPGVGLTPSQSQSSLQVTGQMLVMTWSQPVAKGSQRVSLVAARIMILDSNPEGMMLLCSSRSLASMNRRRLSIRRMNVLRRILMSWQTRKSASSMRTEKRKGDSNEKEIPLHSSGSQH